MMGLAVTGAIMTDFDIAAPRRPAPPGKPGDFDFLEGRWRIRNRRLPPGETAWDDFEGESVCATIMGGTGSVEDLRIPARGFAGLGLRLLDRERGVWVDHWVSARTGVVDLPGTDGGFFDGAGVFDSDDVDDGVPVIVRGVWDQITSDSCRWRQATSRDGGASWSETWIMHWSRL